MSRYTAQEMREAADTMDECLREMEDGNSMYWRNDHITSEDWKAMLLQAADAMEREDKREKKYEYCVIFGGGVDREYIFESEEIARIVAGDSLQVVRREVGEWEEVEDGE